MNARLAPEHVRHRGSIPVYKIIKEEIESKIAEPYKVVIEKHYPVAKSYFVYVHVYNCDLKNCCTVIKHLSVSARST